MYTYIYIYIYIITYLLLLLFRLLRFEPCVFVYRREPPRLAIPLVPRQQMRVVADLAQSTEFRVRDTPNPNRHG